MQGRLFLIDGHALIFKMYYAFLRRPMVNSKGADVSILYGFTKYVLELIEKEKPTHLAIGFDPPGGSFRNQMYPPYKANRAETPQLVIDALDPLIQICKALNVPVLMIPGFEADDVLGSAAKKAAREGYDVYMVTPDKDYGQLIQRNIWQYKPGKAGGDAEVVGISEICAKYSILDPVQVIDMLAICGDASDNVPGVTGIGEVGAGKLISKYGSLENIYAHLEELTPKQQQMFNAALDHIYLSKELVTIKTDIEIKPETEEMAVNMDFSPEIADLFAKYEFASLTRHISHISASKPADAPAAYSAELDIKKVSPSQMILNTCAAGRCAIVVEPGSGRGIFAGIRRVTVATLYKDQCFASEGSAADFKRLLEDPSVLKTGYEVKYQLNLLAAAGVKLNGRILDVELMHYLLNPEKTHKLDILAKSYLGTSLDDGAKGDFTGTLFSDEDSAPQPSSKIKEAAAIMQISARIWNEMKEAGVVRLYEKMEEPLIRVLSSMERVGVKIDLESLKDFADSLRAEIAEKEALVRKLSGEPSLNVGSPKQIGEVLFEKMKIDPKARKSARGSWSTDEETLLEYADKNPIIEAILDYRAAKKLLSTYIEPFPDYISEQDGRVHTTFNQALTSTGRLSSSNPNLQNIPIRTERGREIRKAFVPEGPDGLILSADYSQIELRVMAHMCGDGHMLKAFQEGEDVHAATAAKIFGVPVAEVTADQRRKAKTANFGIMYGISAFGLAQRLRVPRSEAKRLIDGYFESFPSIRAFIDNTIAQARTDGYVQTLFGRRRYIQDINIQNATLRALAERNAVNAPIQGTAADIIKLAMIAVDKELRESGMNSRMVLQIHDELVFETDIKEVEALKSLVTRCMENVIKLSVPLTVECNYGKNWIEAH
ncbi:MAG: DNA polymerase I [Bacteroidales bacterium]|nr:DNA polymerase I [Bacteroidales bacterium]MBQ5416058.1 DNA polymerase I [Bacteroidales bacterium]